MKCVLMSALTIVGAFSVFAALPEGYTPLLYIESTVSGRQYINTDVQPANKGIDVTVTYQMTAPERPKTGNWYIFGSFIYGGVARCQFAYCSNGCNMIGFGSTAESSVDVTGYDNDIHTVAFADGRLVFDGVEKWAESAGWSSYYNDRPLYICAQNSWAGLADWAPIRVYSAKIWNGSKKLVRDFVPAENADGVAGLYDVVGGKFYPSASVEAFVAGRYPAALEIGIAPSDLSATADPAIGSRTDLGAGEVKTVSCAATVALSETARYVCMGWKSYDLDGTFQSEGAGNALEYVHPDPSAYRKLVWQYEPEYLFTNSASAGGSVSSTAPSGWYGASSNVTLTAQADAGRVFVEWSGDVAEAEKYLNPLTIAVGEKSIALTAVFAADEVELTFDLDGAGTFDENGQATIAVTAVPGQEFPPIPAFHADEQWVVAGFGTPAVVPALPTTYVARKVPSALRIVYLIPPDDPLAASSAGTGESWANAYTNFAAAYADAGVYRGEVWAKTGRYVIRETVPMRSNVAVRGGFTGKESSASAADPDANPTVFTGDVKSDDTWQCNGERGSIWSGLVFNAPNPDGTDAFWQPTGHGSDNTALFIENAAGTVTNVCLDGIIITCFAKGAIASVSGRADDVTISRCKVLGNAKSAPSDNDRSVIRIVGNTLTFRNCLFQGNWNSVYFNSVNDSSLTVESCTFADCAGGTYWFAGAGAFYVDARACVQATNCVFRRCSCSGYNHAAAATLLQSVGRHTFDDCVFEENRNSSVSVGTVVLADGRASGVFNRCRFVRNSMAYTDGTYETHHAACIGVNVMGGENLYLNGCWFEGNSLSSSVSTSGRYAASCVGNRLSGVLYAANCSFLANTNVATAVGANATVVGNSAAAFVHCAFKDSVTSGEGTSDIYHLGTRTLGIVNSVLESSEIGYVALKTADAAFSPSFSHSYIQEFDEKAYPVSGMGYCTNIFTTGGPVMRARPRTGPNGLNALAATAFFQVGRPVWRKTETGSFYFYDPDSDAGHPWRTVGDKTQAYSSVEGITLQTPCMPDAFGKDRKSKRMTLGPLKAQSNGFCISFY